MTKLGSIYTLPVPDNNGSDYTITALANETHYVLFDTGFLTSYADIQQQLKENGLADKELAGIYFTHQDMDHVGGFLELIAANPDVPVFAYGKDADAIDGQTTFIKFNKERQEGVLPHLPTDIQEKFAYYFGGEHPNVTHRLKAAEVLSILGEEVHVIPTPGHTPGHVSYYHPASGTLIVGDALTSDGQVLLPPSVDYTPNYPEAIESLAAYLPLTLATVICYHGGALSDQDFHQQIKQIQKTAAAE